MPLHVRKTVSVWLDQFIDDPPVSVASLERVCGALELDFAAHEGFGSVVRSHRSLRGRLIPEVRMLRANFGVDLHHDDPYRPREMRLGSLDLDLDIGHATVVHALTNRFGPGREIEARRVVEYRQRFYLDALPDGAAHLVLEWMRPEWAIPPPLDGAREHLLDALMDRLVTDTEIEPLTAAIEPLVAPALGELNTLNEGRIYMAFRPALPIELVLGVLRWDTPHVSSFDTHMTSWSVYPVGNFRGPHIGPWCVEVRLDGSPTTHRGAFPEKTSYLHEYDARALANGVFLLAIYKPR